MRACWVLEEGSRPYDVCLVLFAEIMEPVHRALHPFGQIWAYEDSDLALLKSGGNRAPCRAAPSRPAARRGECPGARSHMDVCGAQHDEAAAPGNSALQGYRKMRAGSMMSSAPVI